MIILSQEKLSDYWDGIAQGFEKSPFEVVLGVVVLLLLIVVPVVLFLLWQKKERRKKTTESRALFGMLTARKKLSASDVDLFEQMSSYAPRGVRDLPSLLTNSRVFSLSARRMKEDGRVSDTRIAALRLKLGLTAPGKRGILRSTAELTEGLSVEVGSGGGASDFGVVESVTPDAVAVRTPARIAKGRSVELKVSKPTGMYAIQSVVVGVEADLLLLGHSEKVKRVQKRRFFRRKMKGAVVLTTLTRKDASEAGPRVADGGRSASGSGQASRGIIEQDPGTGQSFLLVPERNVKTRLLDLSAGGARVQNPVLALEAGQAVLLTMQGADKKLIKARATVVRTSGGDSSVSLKFGALEHGVRDRIARIVLR